MLIISVWLTKRKLHFPRRIHTGYCSLFAQELIRAFHANAPAMRARANEKDEPYERIDVNNNNIEPAHTKPFLGKAK